MELLISSLPKIHLGFVIILLLYYLFRTSLLIKNSSTTHAKSMNSFSSFITLAAFFSGTALAFLQKTPFSDPFILTKIIGLLVLVGFGIAAFFPRRKKTTALLLLAISFIIYVYLFLVSQGV